VQIISRKIVIGKKHRRTKINHRNALKLKTNSRIEKLTTLYSTCTLKMLKQSSLYDFGTFGQLSKLMGTLFESVAIRPHAEERSEAASPQAHNCLSNGTIIRSPRGISNTPGFVN